MARTLTASDRKSLIRLASTLPVGSPERKAILAGLSRVAGRRWKSVADAQKDYARFAVQGRKMIAALERSAKSYERANGYKGDPKKKKPAIEKCASAFFNMLDAVEAFAAKVRQAYEDGVFSDDTPALGTSMLGDIVDGSARPWFSGWRRRAEDMLASSNETFGMISPSEFLAGERGSSETYPEQFGKMFDSIEDAGRILDK